MELTQNKYMMQLLTFFLLILLPLLLILGGVLTVFLNGVYYLLSIFWFGMGLIFYKVIEP
jgi:hypothetical protein